MNLNDILKKYGFLPKEKEFSCGYIAIEHQDGYTIKEDDIFGSEEGIVTNEAELFELMDRLKIPKSD